MEILTVRELALSVGSESCFFRERAKKSLHCIYVCRSLVLHSTNIKEESNKKFYFCVLTWQECFCSKIMEGWDEGADGSPLNCKNKGKNAFSLSFVREHFSP